MRVILCGSLLSFVLLSSSALARDITIKVVPATAQILSVDPLNPALTKVLGTGSVVVRLKGKETLQVRSDLAGFVSSRVVKLDKNSPKKLDLALTDWLVKLDGTPNDAVFFVNKVQVASGVREIVVPRGQKAAIELRKPGFKTVEVLPILENLPGSTPLPEAKVELGDWLIALHAPDGADLSSAGAAVTGPLVVTKGAKVRVRMEKEGFAPKEFEFDNSAGKRHPGPTVDLKFDRRLVLVTSRTPGAQISTVPAQPPVSTGTKIVEVERDTCLEANVTMPGHEIVTRKYCFLEGEPEPPIKDVIGALRPAVQIRVTSPMGVLIFFNGVQVGTQTATVPLPDNVATTCYNLKLEKQGYVPLEELRCDNTPQIQRELRDRVLTISASPPTADIVADGRKVGTGSADVIVRDMQKTRVRAQGPGFVSSSEIEFENRAGVLTPPQASTIQLIEDPAFRESVSAIDQANINFTIEVNPAKSPDEAWKLISLIALDSFDVVEVIDKDTGYMRSAWEVKDFGATQVRTRLIVKSGDTAPLKYIVKLVSEHGEKPPSSAPIGTEIRFTEFPRLLPKYKDIINEMTFRLR